MTSHHSPKVGVYFSHYECFGHTSRVMSVGEIIKKRFSKAKLFFIQAGLAQQMSRIGQLGELYSLPSPFIDRRYFKGPLRASKTIFDQRSRACLDIIVRQRPDLLMTEFFPLGLNECRHELLKSLVKVSLQKACLWSVCGYPLLTGLDEKWRNPILKLYQKIFIFSPVEEKDHMAQFFSSREQRRRYLDFFKAHASKIIFAGYLLPKNPVVRDDEDVNVPKPSVPQGALRVLVIRGGGVVYPKLIAQAILASEILGPGYHWTVIAGPATTLQEWYLFNTLASKKKIKNLVLLRSVAHYEGLIQESDVCVSTTGYHSSVMLLKHQKKALLVPFEGYKDKSAYEQLSRAYLLQEMIGAKILPFKKLTAQALAKAVAKQALSPCVKSGVCQKWFKGEDVFDKALEGYDEAKGG
ncbi:MAG: hypothetical protein HQL13_02340 [Candidatus Omnitrophica bacterium]|nr:hypothetical protein [Candidatus Omnitrophota bacterium]